MNDHPRTLVAIATYNEIDNLPRLADEIAQQIPAADLLVVDDNSPDGTGRWCDERAAEDARVRVIHRSGKLGLGTATLAAMRYALESDYELLLTMDADFSHPPRYVPDLLRGMSSDRDPVVDVMIGSRYVAGGDVEGWPLVRRMMSRMVNLYARILLGLSPRDCSGAFRCYRVSTLRRLDLNRVRARGYAFFEEILWRLKQQGARFGETPIVFVERRRGRSKIDLREAFSALWTILCLSWERRRAETTRGGK